jgi:hypothetical protein
MIYTQGTGYAEYAGIYTRTCYVGNAGYLYILYAGFIGYAGYTEYACYAVYAEYVGYAWSRDSIVITAHYLMVCIVIL